MGPEHDVSLRPRCPRTLRIVGDAQRRGLLHVWLEAVVTVLSVATAGLVALSVAAAVCVLSGLVVLLDWHGYGKRYYEFAIDFPGGSLTKKLGHKYFRAVAGWGALAFGVILAVLITVAATGTH